MRTISHGFSGKLSIILAAALVLAIGAPLFAAEKATDLPVSISSVTDAMGSININVGKGENIKEGYKGVVTRDGKQIAEYVVQQVNWGFSRITLTNVVEGFTIRPGDSAPITTVPPEPPKKKSKAWNTTKILTVLALGAAIYFLADGLGGSGGSGDSAGEILITAQKTSNTSPTGTTGTISITAAVNDKDGFPVPDGTPVTFASTAGTLSRTQASTSAGRATSTLSYDVSVDPDTATITVKSLNKTATKVVSLISSINLVVEPLTIEAKDTGSGVQTATITATCLDAMGVPATSGSVTFTATLGQIPAPAQVPIGAGGVASTTYSSLTAGTATITATWGTSKATQQIIVTAGPPHSMTVATDSNSIQADGNSFARITATVKNSKGANVTDGTVVNFSVIPDGGGGGNGTIVPVQTSTVNGVATAFLYSRDSVGSPSKSGTATVKVEVLIANQPGNVPLPVTDLVNQATTVQFVSPEVAEINLSAQPSNIKGWNTSGNTSTITAEVKNTDGQPVPNGTAIYFTTTRGTIVGTEGGNLSRTNNGIATATLTANVTWYGNVTVTATSGSAPPGDCTVIFSGPAVGAESEASLSQTELAAVGGQALVSIIARDVNGNPVANGTTVTVTTDKGTVSSNGSGSTSGGLCSFTLSMSTNVDTPTQTGPGTVSVTVGGSTDGFPITLPFTVVPAP